MRSEEKVFSKMKKTSLPNLFFYSKKRIEIRIFSKEKKKSLNFFFFFFLMFETDIQQIFFYSGLIIFKKFFFIFETLWQKQLLGGKKFSLFFLFDNRGTKYFSEEEKNPAGKNFLNWVKRKFRRISFVKFRRIFFFIFENAFKRKFLKKNSPGIFFFPKW